MPRTIEIAMPSDRSEALIKALETIPGVVGVSQQRHASLRPPGDVLVIRCTNEASGLVLKAIAAARFPEDASSIVTTEPRSIVSKSHERDLQAEGNETIWEEMDVLLRQETTLAFNYLFLMGAAGAIAAVGLWTNTLHLVIGSMVIAPGFEPILRVPFGAVVKQPQVALRGAASLLCGYLLLATGAALTTGVLAFLMPQEVGRLVNQDWMLYWRTLTPGGALLSVVAGAAGATVVTAQRSVLSIGVMISTALIPASAIVGIGLAIGQGDVAVEGLGRWAADAVGVLGSGGAVLWVKQRLGHRRLALS